MFYYVFSAYLIYDFRKSPLCKLFPYSCLTFYASHTWLPIMASEKIEETFELTYKLFFVTLSFHSQTKLRKCLENCFYGLLIFPVSLMNLFFEVSLVNLDAKLALLSIGELLLTQFSAINILIFAKIMKPKLKRFFTQTDKLINQIEYYSKTKIGVHNYSRRISNFRLAAVVACNLIQFLVYLSNQVWGRQTKSSWLNKIFYFVFCFSNMYYNSLWIFGTGFIINCTCMEIYIKILFVLKLTKCKYRDNFYIRCNQAFRNIDNLYSIFDTAILLLLSYTFTNATASAFCLVCGIFGLKNADMILYVVLSFLVLCLLVQNGNKLFQGVSTYLNF